MIRSVIAEILSPPDNAPERHHLKILKREWDGHILPDPGDDDTGANEAQMLFVEFGLSIKACNEANPAWGGMSRVNAARAGGDNPLRDRCTFIAKLLCAMIWTPLAWQELPSIGKGKTLHHVVEPTLLTAGKEMARGRDFSLPNDPTHADDSPNLPGKWQAHDLWNFQISPEIAAGIGIDDKILLVNGLAKQFKTKLFERNSAAALSDDQRLTKFLADLSQIILARAIQEKRGLTLAKSFPAINAPGWDEFFGLVSALLDPRYSVVDGLAFSGEQSTLYVRCNEILLLNQIRFCREQIAAIP